MLLLIALRVAREILVTNFLPSVIKVASEILIQDLENEAVARTVSRLIIGQLRLCRVLARQKYRQIRRH